MKKMMIISLASLVMFSLTAKGLVKDDITPVKTGTGTVGIKKTTDDGLVATLDEALKKTHVFKNLSKQCFNSSNLVSPYHYYYTVFDTTTPEHTKYIGVYDAYNKVIIVDGGSQKIGTPFVVKGFYTGKIVHGEFSTRRQDYLSQGKKAYHVYNSLTDDKDDNEIFRYTLGKHTGGKSVLFQPSCPFTYNM